MNDRFENDCPEEQIPEETDMNWREKYENDLESFADPYDFETESSYLEAVESEKYAWRNLCDDNEFGINPDDYDTVEEYSDALENAKFEI